jgi:hypothetical protein
MDGVICRAVDHSYREVFRRKRSGEKTDRGASYASRIRAGETLFFIGRDQTSFGGLAKMAAGNGGRLVTRVADVDGARGVLVWMEYV